MSRSKSFSEWATMLAVRLLVLVAGFVWPALLHAQAQWTPANAYIFEAQGQFPGNLAEIVAASGGTLQRVFPDIGLASATSTDANFSANLARSGLVGQVVQDVIVRWLPPTSRLQPAGVSPTTQGKALLPAPTAAFFYPCQWNMTQVDAAGAWAKGQFGDPDVKVAVLDSGIDPVHIDLAGKVDIAQSASFLTTGSSACGPFDESTIIDFNSHGTFVSGIITSNNIVVAGVAPLSRVVAIKVLNCTGVGLFGDVIAGIVYAAGLPDAEILNLSLGATVSKSMLGAGRLVGFFNKAVSFAAGKGKLVVAGANETGTDLDGNGNSITVPAESANVVGVYATDILDHLASYSDHGISGTWVGAPGGDFNTVAPLPGCVLNPALQSLVIGPCSTFSSGCPGGFPYLLGFGTSFAAPVVSGVAALVDAKHDGMLNGNQLKAILAQSAEDLGKPGVDNTFSHGRVNASSAVDY